MGDRIVADRFGTGHRNREVDTQMTFEVICGDVLCSVRRIMGGTDVSLAVGERDPDYLWRPGCFTAECLLHNGRIFSCDRFRVHVSILCHDAQTPGITG